MERRRHRIDESALAGAETVAGLTFTPAQRRQILRGNLPALGRAWATGPHDELGPADAPACGFDPRLPGMRVPDRPDRVVPSRITARLPHDDEDIAFAPLTHLARWIESKRLTSERLTRIYLERLERFDRTLRCVVTLMPERALAAARQADREIAEGRYRGPLHGVPWGAKDLLDTRGVATTWGAAPYRDRVPDSDAEVVRRLDRAGAVLVAKLTLGALAMGDYWFGGRTRNPFAPRKGSSGSSAGSAAAVAAGLVGFAIGSETNGSIISPATTCGAAALRPTFGRVPRTGAMPLCWSMDKLGPLGRGVEDTLLVLAAIAGSDGVDGDATDLPLCYEAKPHVRGLRVGYQPAAFRGTNERKALRALKSSGVHLVRLPDPEFGGAELRAMLAILNVEAAAVFDELVRSGRVDDLVRQTAHSWPNRFRSARLVPAVEYVQAQRRRKRLMTAMARIFDEIDAWITPGISSEILTATNFTGHPALTVRSGFARDRTPRACTLFGRLYDEGTLCNLGRVLERELAVRDVRPRLD